MNRPTKRLLALAGSALVGAFGAIALASPAQAHHNDLVGKGVCQADGQFEVIWKVTHPDSWGGRIAKITNITKSVSTDIQPVAPTTSFGVGTFIPPKTSIVGRQIVPTASASLTVAAQWFEADGKTPAKHPNGKDITHTARANAMFDVTSCEPKPIPSATFLNNCDGTVKVHLINPTSKAVDFTVKGGDNWTKTVNVAAKGEADVVVPAENAKVAIVVSAGKDEIAKSPPWARPSECPKPTPLGESTCDKFTIQLSNPEEGQSTEATVTYGTQVKKVTVAPGKTETVELTPSSETEATIKFAGWADIFKVKYEKPADCGGLPQTGASTGAYVASGTGLAALGVLVFFMARRRQVRLRRMASM
ncbi:LPXTG cell wall anchor domain-containing protein [Allorhizocola rhizosphaerae]|uniref:LPXTG cell wall anchor domain-containing protein n=1 Tax=Allorhizocola rhizosphaerae TaxID=1872709 RepID=UPI000E3C8686|nr:LPXTG cell wall anchor domain-containing protein [Allorhizocola rhizosphaerae]